jgi:hypothetical protein
VKGAQIYRQNISVEDKKTVLYLNVKSAEGIYMISLFNTESILTKKIFIDK